MISHKFTKRSKMINIYIQFIVPRAAGYGSVIAPLSLFRHQFVAVEVTVTLEG